MTHPTLTLLTYGNLDGMPLVGAQVLDNGLCMPRSAGKKAQSAILCHIFDMVHSCHMVCILTPMGHEYSSTLAGLKWLLSCFTSGGSNDDC
jgi:hypothetical protein